MIPVSIVESSQTSTAIAAAVLISLGVSVGSVGVSTVDTSPVNVPKPAEYAIQLTESPASTSLLQSPYISKESSVGSLAAPSADTSSAHLLKFPDQVSQVKTSFASTSFVRATYVQFIKPLTPETQPQDYTIDLSWKTNWMAGREADQILQETLEQVQTEESLEKFEVSAAEFVDGHGVTGIGVLESRLLRTGDASTEPLARRFLRALGAQRGAAIDGRATRLLIEQLNSPSGGRRSAAASALGAFPSRQILTALERRKEIETNRIVLATLEAHIRVFRSNGVSSTKAV